MRATAAGQCGTAGGHVLALAGGVGGAKLARGLAAELPADALTVAVNVGDDFEHLGLHVAPDLDSVMYALAGLNDEQRGWGLAGESWQFMAALGRLGGEDWFALGDQDLATHVLRSLRLRAGEPLSAVTTQLCQALGIEHTVTPVTDQPLRTLVTCDEGELPFQHYFVARRCEPAVRGFRFEGADAARPAAALVAALARPDLRAIIICPSNPFISIDPMLAVPGLADALQAAPAPVVAVTPIVGGSAIKGPAAKMLAELGHDVSAVSVARHYGPLLDGFVLDAADAADAARLHPLAVHVTDTLMRDDPVRRRLAGEVLAFADRLRG